MEALLGELGRRLSGRWWTQLVAPGLLWLAALCCAHVLDHTDALDSESLVAWAERTSDHLRHRPIAAVMVLGGTVLLAAGVGLLMTACARAVLALWLGRWVGPGAWLAGTVTQWRRHRADKRGQGKTLDRYLPSRPTWIGDQIRLIDQRVDVQYGVSLKLIWPRLWLLLDDAVRAPVHDARDRLDHAARLAGWGVLYTVLGSAWWPGLGAGVVVLFIAWYTGRTAVTLFATVVEATVDTHLHRLAAALGVAAPHGRITPAEGAVINDQINKGA
jgi:hypothetical protein